MSLTKEEMDIVLNTKIKIRAEILYKMRSILVVCFKRNVFEPSEMSQIGKLYDYFDNSLELVIENCLKERVLEEPLERVERTVSRPPVSRPLDSRPPVSRPPVSRPPNYIKNNPQEVKKNYALMSPEKILLQKKELQTKKLSKLKSRQEVQNQESGPDQLQTQQEQSRYQEPLQRQYENPVQEQDQDNDQFQNTLPETLRSEKISKNVRELPNLQYVADIRIKNDLIDSIGSRPMT